MKISNAKLTRNILIGMGLGLILGLALNFSGLQKNEWISSLFIEGVFDLVGNIFVRSLKLLVVPLVFVSLVCGTAAMDDVRKLGKIGIKTMGLYLLTTCIAISLAMGLAFIFKPGQGVAVAETTDSISITEAPSIWEVITNMFPTNPVQAMAEGSMLQVIVFSILFGLAIVVSGKPGQRILSIFTDLNEIVLKLVMILMLIAPYGVFAKITVVFAVEGVDAIWQLGRYFFLVILALVLHAVIVYPSLLKLLSGLSPIRFLKNFYKVQIFAFSTASSNATLPVTLETAEKKLGVNNSTASFTIPLGATINMDGTAIMQGVATIFIAQISGVDLTIGQLLMVIVTATLASIGTAGVPGVGLVMLTMVLNQVGLPIEKISLIIGIDRILDMIRTAVNVTGDAAVTCIVAKGEGQLDESIYNSDTQEEVARS
ncbi:dicarboxylate/amino acid:cation symporter [Pelagicoccus sp. SDUM812003]|uniref:dicarboxylate/amino acid:cation symporter n=1 Tax=Pelagicoccus sp. SDUM812003 TaxID=3041267 RepID=UPI00280C6B93|nr:dicarboxylate/amino acid:cation symporter [Pelagicoccus sp. SDUM812003]MDQ8205409.1 dicarboxylate/amino acid:cation symporter [Pelagicoccus sp. SDUM812003]